MNLVYYNKNIILEYRVKDIQIQYSAEQQTIYFIGTNEADNIQELYVPTADYKLDFKEINKIANDLDPQKQFNGYALSITFSFLNINLFLFFFSD